MRRHQRGKAPRPLPHPKNLILNGPNGRSFWQVYKISYPTNPDFRRMADKDPEYEPPRRTSPRRRKKMDPIIVSDASDDDSNSPTLAVQKCDSLPFQPAHLTMADLDDVKQDRCFNDAIVNSYLVYLANNNDPGSTIGYTNSFFINKLRRDGCKAASCWKGIEGRRLNVYNKFLIPISTMSHWILVEISFPESAIRIYDSLGRHGSSLISDIKRFMHWQHIHTKFVTRYPPVPKQDNCHDCGVFVCEFARCIFKEIPLNKKTFDPSDSPSIRQRIYEELLPALSCPLL